MNLAPEFALALDCTRIHADDAARERIRAHVLQGIDWSAFLRFAIPHGILPLAARTLRHCAEDLAPHATLQQLDMVLARARLRYTLQCQALGSVMQALDRAGIRALAYKGPALVAAAYPDPGLREFHDLDIWTAPTETAAAGEVLRSLGYKPSSYKQGELRHGADRGAMQNEFASADGQVVLDLLNLERAPQFYFCPEFEELWERRRMVSLEGGPLGRQAATLSVEDLLPALAVHGSKHYWRRLNWSVDIAALLARSDEVEWETVLVRAERWRCTRRLLCALAMQAELYGYKPPPAIARALAARPKMQAAARQATQRVFDRPAVGTLRNALSVFYYHYRCTDRWEDKVNLAQAELLRRYHRAATRAGKSLRRGTGTVFEVDAERGAAAR